MKTGVPKPRLKSYAKQSRSYPYAFNFDAHATLTFYLSWCSSSLRQPYLSKSHSSMQDPITQITHSNAGICQIIITAHKGDRKYKRKTISHSGARCEYLTFIFFILAIYVGKANHGFTICIPIHHACRRRQLSELINRKDLRLD